MLELTSYQWQCLSVGRKKLLYSFRSNALVTWQAVVGISFPCLYGSSAGVYRNGVAYKSNVPNNKRFQRQLYPQPHLSCSAFCQSHSPLPFPPQRQPHTSHRVPSVVILGRGRLHINLDHPTNKNASMLHLMQRGSLALMLLVRLREK